MLVLVVVVEGILRFLLPSAPIELRFKSESVQSHLLRCEFLFRLSLRLHIKFLLTVFILSHHFGLFILDWRGGTKVLAIVQE